MTLGEKIKFLRIKKGITQEAFAEKLNVSRSAIAKWETNGGVPEISNLKMISQIFDFRNDDYVDVVINSFQDSKILLKFGKEINIDTITKIEELDV